MFAMIVVDEILPAHMHLAMSRVIEDEHPKSSALMMTLPSGWPRTLM
jgi:hypothetical protein